MIEFVSGSSSSQNVVEFTLPLAPDDRMSWTGSSWSSTPSDAAVKARNYGRVQNRLLLGNRAGMEIQVLPDRVPDMAGDGIAISMGGLTAQYLVNNLSYVINADGMVASVNACFWGALGATPGFNLVNAWTPTAPGLTALPTPPAVTGGTTITTPTGGTVVSGGTVGTGPIYPPYNEVVRLTGIVRARAIWTRKPYALTLPTRAMDVVLKVLTPPPPPPPPTPLSLLLMNGTDGSTTFTDEVGTTWTSNSGVATIATAQSKFGGASGRFAGAGARITATDASFNIGTGDFTISGWVRLDSTSGDHGIFNFGSGTFHGVYVSDATLYLYDSDYRAQTGAVITALTWYHFAVCRNSGVVECYVNGVGSGNPYTSSFDFNSSDHLWGASRNGNDVLTGYLDGVAFYDTALYSGNFTPPTTEPSMP
jgi:hypothetical protein